MPTVQALVDQVVEEAGLSDGDRAFALGRLNGAYARLALKLELDTEVEIPVTSLDTQVDVSSYVQELSYVGWRTAAGAQIQLAYMTTRDMFQQRAASYPPVAGTEQPTAYAFSWPNVLLDPVPGADGTLVVWGIVAPPTLVESGAVAGQEETPSLIPVGYHEDVLARDALVRVLEGLEGMEERASYHRGLLTVEMENLVAWRWGAGGADAPERAHQPWGTPHPVRSR